MATRARSKYEDSYNRMIKSGSYSYSSHALVLEPDDRGDDYIRKPSRPSTAGTRGKRTHTDIKSPVGKATKRKQKARPGPVYAFDIKKSPKSRLLNLTAFVVIFIGSFLIVFSIAYTESRKLELNRFQNELKQLKIDNIVLKGEILDSYDLAEIEKDAIALGMTKPLESQIIYLPDVKISYMERYESEEDDVSPLQIFDNIIASLKKLIWTEAKAGEGS